MRVLGIIMTSGLVAGALYILSALSTFVPRGATAMSLLQYVGSGVLGQYAFSGGWITAAFGLALHFVIATIMAGAFVLTARAQPILFERPWASGVLYGAALYIAMAYVAVPLSAAPRWAPGQGWDLVGRLMAHCFYVGVPIALIARRLRRRSGHRLSGASELVLPGDQKPSSAA